MSPKKKSSKPPKKGPWGGYFTGGKLDVANVRRKLLHGRRRLHQQTRRQND